MVDEQRPHELLGALRRCASLALWLESRSYGRLLPRSIGEAACNATSQNEGDIDTKTAVRPCKETTALLRTSWPPYSWRRSDRWLLLRCTPRYVKGFFARITREQRIRDNCGLFNTDSVKAWDVFQCHSTRTRSSARAVPAAVRVVQDTALVLEDRVPCAAYYHADGSLLRSRRCSPRPSPTSWPATRTLASTNALSTTIRSRRAHTRGTPAFG